jgi:diguanylate cyclase (GGDEF)-like protein/PAS domain S-box-containing protein
MNGDTMKKSRIMIVEDEGITAMSIRNSLESMGYEVSSIVNSGEDAVQKALEDRPDLVVMDISLTGKLDGIEAAAQIRSLLDIPVVYLTAHSDERMLQRAKITEPFGYIVKPFEDRELRIAVEIAVHNYRMEHKLRESETKYRSLFDNASDAIYLISSETQRIVDCNPRASVLSGYPPRELRTMKVEELYPSEEQDIVSKIFRKISKKTSLSGISGIHHLKKDGVRIPVEISASTISVGGEECCLAIIRDISERVRAEEELKESKEKYHALFRHMFIGCALHKIIVDEQAKPVDYIFLEVNDAFLKLTELKRVDVIGKRVTEVIPGIERSRFDWIQEYGKIAQKGGTLKSEQYSEQLKKWYSIYVYRPLADHFIALYEDITERKMFEEDLFHAKEQWELTFDTIPDPIIVTDNHYNIVRVNRAMADRYGTERERLIGEKCYSVVHGTKSPPRYCPHTHAKNKNRESVSEIYQKKSGTYFTVSSTPIAGRPGEIKGYVEVFHDITERKKMEERLEKAAMTDALTGLLNRRGFMTYAERQLKLSDRTKKGMTLLYIDLNGMKAINDGLGHDQGDRALADTAAILEKTFRQSDITARIGGDEFAVLLTTPSGPDIETVVSGHLQRHLDEHNKKSGRPYQLSLSMGMAHYEPGQPEVLGRLLNAADASMYQNKKNHGTALQGEKQKERRAHDRLGKGKFGDVEINAAQKAKIKNISRSGICLHTRKRLKTGNEYDIVIHDGEDVLSLKGNLVWSMPLHQKSFSHEAGLRFVAMDKRNEKSLDDYMNRVRSGD